MRAKDYDEIYFTGDGKTYTTLDNDAASDQTVAGGADPIGIVRMPSTGHGFNVDSCVYIQGTTNYNGLRKIVAVSDADHFDIRANYVAETFAGTETVKTMYSSPHPFELMGIEVHVDNAPVASETLVVVKDAAAGSAWDTKVYTTAMNGVENVSENFDPTVKCSADDKVDVTWDNTDGDTWGIKLLVRRLGG